MDYFNGKNHYDYKHMTPDEKRDELRHLIANTQKNINAATGREQTESRKKRVERWRNESARMEYALQHMANADFDDMNGTRFNETPGSRMDYYIEYRGNLNH